MQNGSMRRAAWFLAACLGFGGAFWACAEDDPATTCDMSGAGKIAWKCPKCEKLWLDGTIDFKACPEDKSTLENVPCCDKVGYVCEADGICQQVAGKCPKCEKDLVAKDFPSEIFYKCPKCGKRDPSGRPGECPDCNVFRKKTCKLSGTCPHLPTPKPDEGKDGGKDKKDGGK